MNAKSEELTKEKARYILNGYILYGIAKGCEPTPIYDELVFSEETETGISQYTFRHLLKVAFNLQDNGQL